MDDHEQRLKAICDAANDIRDSVFVCVLVPFACFAIGCICGASAAIDYARDSGFDWESPVVVTQEKE